MKSAWNRVGSWLKVSERRTWLQYGILAIIILLPVLLPGYVLTLDMVFAPHFQWPAEVTNTYPLDIALWLLNQILPGDVIQKIVLFATITLSGVGAHLLVKQFLRPGDVAVQIAPYFAGLFYAINPFIYARLMAGQWLLLLGYALLPFFVLALFRLLQRPMWRTAIVAAAWAWGVVTASVHLIGVVLVFGGLFVLAAIVKYWHRKKELVRVAWSLLLTVGLVLLVSSYWLVPALFGFGPVSEIAANAGATEFNAYATHGGPLGPIGEVLRLQGFWAESRQLFVLPQDVMPLWGVLMLLLWVLAGIGAVHAWKTNRAAAIIMIGSGIVGVVLAASPLVQGLSQIFPLFGGWREPHKFTVLIVLGYAVLGAFGVAKLSARFGKKNPQHGRNTALLCLALPLLLTPTMFWAGGGQLRPVDYPIQWHTLNTRLNELVGADEKVLFLPWHMYAPYSFSNGRIIANPADKFFEIPMIISDDPEFADVAPNRTNETNRQLAELLDDPHDIRAGLAELNVHYVVLAKEQSWQDYTFLGQLQRIHEDEKIILYEVK